MSSGGESWTVARGDCIASLAFATGHFPDTLWDHPENAQLKSLRKDPNVLCSGDVVFIPELREKEESRGANATHRFRRKGVPAKLNFQLFFNGKPRADIPYLIDIDGTVREGQTDGDGWVRESIPPNAQHGKLTLRPKGKPEEVFELQLGHLDPVDSVPGQKARLRNLGFFAGDIDAEVTEDFCAAVKAFQKKQGLTVSGTVDDATRSKIESEHQS